MGKIAFVFSGQGDQSPGMGRELCAAYPVAKAIFAQCDRIRPGTSAQCFFGSAEALSETKNTQPCLFAMELAAAGVLLDAGIVPDAVAGFSLGEVVAATVSGTFDADTGFRLVCRRGELMQREAEKCDTSMAAIVKLPSETVEDVCRRHADVYPVNYTCPGQVTVAGLSARMGDFFDEIKAAGGRAIPLKVKGAFHSPFMREAAAAFAEVLSRVEMNERRIPLYANLTGAHYGEDTVDLLSRQICQPVQWEKCIRAMIADGVDTFVEIGPGQTLTKMTKKINADVHAVPYTAYLEEARC